MLSSRTDKYLCSNENYYKDYPMDSMADPFKSYMGQYGYVMDTDSANMVLVVRIVLSD